MSWIHINWITLSKMCCALLFFSVGFLLDDLMTGVAMFRARNLLNNPLENPVLPDIGFDLLPYPKICEGSLLPTYLLLILMLVTFCRMILFNDEGVIVFCRFAIVDGIVMSLRATTVAVTSLNNPWPHCNYCSMKECPQSLEECVLYTLKRFPFYDCGDLIFSGHTVHYLMCALVWCAYFTGHKLWKVLIWIFVVLGLVTVVMCRFHYTVDVLLGVYLTVLTWKLYDYFNLQSDDDSLLSRFIHWIESPPNKTLSSNIHLQKGTL